MANPLPKDGKVVVTFPAGFDLATAAPAATSAAEIDGTFVTTAAGQVVTITRQDDGADKAAGAAIDTLTTVPLVAITAGAISSATVTPASLVASASGNAVLAFTMANPLPKDGKVVVTFPAGFDLATAAPAATSAAEIDGTFVTTVAGQVVTITRQDDGADEAAGAITDLTLSNIGNP